MQLKPHTLAMTVLLAFMTAVGPVTMDIYLASMPHIGRALGASTGAVQLTLSLYLVVGVESTARSAWEHGYQIAFVQDAMSSFSNE